jgi:hypothetical protein
MSEVKEKLHYLGFGAYTSTIATNRYKCIVHTIKPAILDGKVTSIYEFPLVGEGNPCLVARLQYLDSTPTDERHARHRTLVNILSTNDRPDGSYICETLSDVLDSIGLNLSPGIGYFSRYNTKKNITKVADIF